MEQAVPDFEFKPSSIRRLIWPIYLMEAALLGAFMVSACSFGMLLEHPRSPVHAALPNAIARRALMGLAMGLTAVVLIYSPWGKRSGAHMNPATTLSFLWFGKISRCDAVFYIVAQFVGAVTGVLLMHFALGQYVGDPAVNHVATEPGKWGIAPAWMGEFAITFVLMSVIVRVNRVPRLAPWTGYFAGALVALYITFESPISGMSMNPARTFGSAAVAMSWRGWWIYFTAPVVGMLTAVEIQHRLSRQPQTLCGKLSHCPHIPCHIRCNCAVHRGIAAEGPEASLQTQRATT